MDQLEAIKHRIAVRSYINAPISKEKITKLMTIINNSNKHANLTIEFIENGSSAFASIWKTYGMFKGVHSIIVMKGLKNDIHLKEKIGYYGEKIILEAITLGLGTCWVGASYDRQNQIFKISENEELVCVIPVGKIANRKTIMATIVSKIMHSKKLEAFYNTNETPPAWFIEGIKAVQLAPSARNTQKVSFTYSNDTVKISIPNDYIFDLVDLGIAKLHFELAANGKFAQGNNVEFHKN